MTNEELAGVDEQVWREALTAFANAGNQAATAIIQAYGDARADAARREALEGLSKWQIGARVKVADHSPDAELWNRDEWFIVGIRHERSHSGLNVSISSEYPMKRDSEGETDGFYVDIPGEPDGLVLLKENPNEG